MSVRGQQKVVFLRGSSGVRVQQGMEDEIEGRSTARRSWLFLPDIVISLRTLVEFALQVRRGRSRRRTNGAMDQYF